MDAVEQDFLRAIAKKVALTLGKGVHSRREKFMLDREANHLEFNHGVGKGLPHDQRRAIDGRAKTAIKGVLSLVNGDYRGAVNAGLSMVPDGPSCGRTWSSTSLRSDPPARIPRPSSRSCRRCPSALPPSAPRGIPAGGAGRTGGARAIGLSMLPRAGGTNIALEQA